jgi:hypothetical protein
LGLRDLEFGIGRLEAQGLKLEIELEMKLGLSLDLGLEIGEGTWGLSIKDFMIFIVS